MAEKKWQQEKSGGRKKVTVGVGDQQKHDIGKKAVKIGEYSMGTIIEVKGTPYEQGISEGKQLRDIIISNIKLVKEKMVKDQINKERYQNFINRNAVFLERSHPEIHEEMKGITEGSKIPWEDILTLNIPAYFMSEYFNQECSMLMVRGKATADGKTYVIKNRDMSTYIEQAVIHREYPGGLKIVEINGAGTVTYPACGMNSYGLGVTNTGFWSVKAPSDVEKADSAHIFLNAHLLLSSCKTAGEALEYIKKSSRMNGLNMIIVDEKDAYAVEMTKNDVAIQEDDGSGILFRSNHYTLDKFKHLNPDMEQYPSTYKRYERMEELVKAGYGKLRFHDLFRIMSDHENGKNSICRHPEENTPAKTISTSLFVLEDKEVWATIGNPCESLRFTSL